MHRYALIIAVCFILSFFVGFIFSELSTSKSLSDNFLVLKNFLYISNNLNLNIDLSFDKYQATRLPIAYLFFNLYLDNINFEILRYNSFLIGLIIFFIFFYILKVKFKNQISQSEIFLLSSILLLSPYFRTLSFWPSEESFVYLCLLLTFLFLNFYKVCENSPIKELFLIVTIFFSYLTFYSSVNFFYFNIALFFSLISYRKIFSLQNSKIIFYNILFLFIPLIFFGEIIVDILFQSEIKSKPRIGFDLDNIVQIGAICLIYILPIIFLEFRLKDIQKNIIKNYKYLLILFILFQFCFREYLIEEDGGGAIQKVLLFIFDVKLFIYFYLSASFLGFYLLYLLSLKFNLILLNIIPAILFYSFVTEIYQEYFDPSILLFYFLFKNKIPENYSILKLVGISMYFFIFLFSSYTYYNLL